MNNKGLTLIELLAALAIVAMLTSACLAVVCRLNAARGRLDSRQAGAGELPDRLVELLRVDIIHARQYRLVPGGFEFAGLSAIEPGSMNRRHLPAEVNYQVVTLAGDCWLVRTQKTIGRPAWSELVCRGVGEITLLDATEEAEQEESIEEAGQLEVDKYVDVPAALEARIVSAGAEGNQPVAQSLWLHRGGM